MYRPFVWIVAAFTAGMAVSRWSALSAVAWLIIASAAAVGALALLRTGRVAWPVLLAGAAAAGALWSLLGTGSPHDPFAAVMGRAISMEGMVSRPPQVVSRGNQVRSRIAVTVDRADGVPPSLLPGVVLLNAPGTIRPAYGDRVRIRGRLYLPPPAGNPGEFSYRDFLSAAGIDAAVTVRSAPDVRVLAHAGGNPILAAAYGLRARMTGFFREGLPGPAGALLSSLLLGDDGAIDPSLREAFRGAGLLHVLVVSGAQVALVLGSVSWLGRLVRAPPRPTAVGGAAVVAFFALMTGWVPSVGRATVMTLAGVAASLLRRDRDVYTSLALAALVLLLAEPSLLVDLGFQLSFAATWGLLYVAPAIVEHLRVGPRWLRSLVGMTVGAQLAVLPILAYHVARISVAGFAANLIVIPVVGFLVPAGFAAAGVGLIVPAAGMAILGALRPLLTAVIIAAGVFSRLPGATIAVIPPAPVAVVGLYAALILAVEGLRRRIRITAPRALAAACALIAVTLWIHAAAAGSSPALVMTVLDVGQGDAILLQAPGGATMLVDGGGDVEGRPSGYDIGAQRVVPALRRLGVRALDVVVLSHPHEDHAGGLPAVLKNFSVGLVLDAGLPHPAPGYTALLRWIERTGISYRLARRGMRLDLGGGVGVAVLHPDEPLLVGTASDANLNSIVLRVTYGTISVLLTGDLEAPIEWQLLQQGEDLRSAVLKVAHHGSATSSTPEFLDAVRPAVAVISVGAWNPFGHPHRRTLDALEAAGGRIYRTDRHGAVTISTDGARLWVRTFRDAGDR